VSNSGESARFKLSATDQTGIYLANISCNDSSSNRLLFLVFKPSETQEPSKLWGLGGFLPIISLTGDAKDFEVEFDVPVRHRSTPGKVVCGILLVDELSKDTIVQNVAQFNVVRDGIGSGNQLVNPTPTPVSSPSPAPSITPTPTPTPTTLQNPYRCPVSTAPTCLGVNGFKFNTPKFTSASRGRAKIVWGFSAEKNENFKFTVQEKRREAKTYKTIVTRSSSIFLERKNLKPGIYDYLVKIKLRSGATEQIIISGKVK
jgi:hypothetical protein